MDEIEDLSEDLEEPRSGNARLHSLHEILVIMVIMVIMVCVSCAG